MTTLRIEDLQYQGRGPFSFTIDSGECVSLSGPSGVGKSQMLRALVDLDPHGGQIFLDNIESAAVHAPQWRRQLGLLPAECQWWFDTVGEHFDEVDVAALSRLGFDSKVMEWPVSRLSSGERQRLGLLRLLANQPRALLLDEPTANLDAENAHQIEDLIAEYRRQRHAPVLWVGHDLEQLQRVAARHLRLSDNHLTEQESL